MTNRIDNEAEAQAILSAYAVGGVDQIAYMTEALAHATLALVEQERIRNLIAVHSADESIERWDQWPAIAAALGLKP